MNASDPCPTCEQTSREACRGCAMGYREELALCRNMLNAMSLEKELQAREAVKQAKGVPSHAYP